MLHGDVQFQRSLVPPRSSAPGRGGQGSGMAGPPRGSGRGCSRGGPLRLEFRAATGITGRDGGTERSGRTPRARGDERLGGPGRGPRLPEACSSGVPAARLPRPGPRVSGGSLVSVLEPVTFLTLSFVPQRGWTRGPHGPAALGQVPHGSLRPTRPAQGPSRGQRGAGLVAAHRRGWDLGPG